MLPRLRSLKALGPRSGFTLIELLVALALSLLLFASILAWMSFYERSRGLMDSQLRLQDRWRRVYQLVASDLQESRPVSGTPVLPCSSGTTVLSMQYAAADPTLSNPVFRYYLSGASSMELWRCGPLSLDPVFGSSEAAYLVSDGASSLNVLVAKGVQSMSLDFSDPQRPVFQLTLVDEYGYSYSNNSTLSSLVLRSRVIGD